MSTKARDRPVLVVCAIIVLSTTSCATPGRPPDRPPESPAPESSNLRYAAFDWFVAPRFETLPAEERRVRVSIEGIPPETEPFAESLVKARLAEMGLRVVEADPASKIGEAVLEQQDARYREDGAVRLGRWLQAPLAATLTLSLRQREPSSSPRDVERYYHVPEARFEIVNIETAEILVEAHLSDAAGTTQLTERAMVEQVWRVLARPFS